MSYINVAGAGFEGGARKAKRDPNMRYIAVPKKEGYRKINLGNGDFAILPSKEYRIGKRSKRAPSEFNEEVKRIMQESKSSSTGKATMPLSRAAKLASANLKRGPFTGESQRPSVGINGSGISGGRRRERFNRLF